MTGAGFEPARLSTEDLKASPLTTPASCLSGRPGEITPLIPSHFARGTEKVLCGVDWVPLLVLARNNYYSVRDYCLGRERRWLQLEPIDTNGSKKKSISEHGRRPVEMEGTTQLEPSIPDSGLKLDVRASSDQVSC